ncbi:MAG: helix-turn-helix transcriptional regulator [Burkholderiales bacterium]
MGRLAQRRTPAPPDAPLAFVGDAGAARRARTVIAHFRSWLAAEGWHEIAVGADGTLQEASRAGRALLAAVAGPAVRPGDPLPDALLAWLRRAGAHATTGAARTLAHRSGGVTLRALPAAESDGWLVYLRAPDADGAAAAGAAAPAVPLSRREREVLDWVAAGKTDAQAAAILGISVRTVQKHLENSYVKLGVEGRTAAVMRIRDAERRAWT